MLLFFLFLYFFLIFIDNGAVFFFFLPRVCFVYFRSPDKNVLTVVNIVKLKSKVSPRRDFRRIMELRELMFSMQSLCIHVCKVLEVTWAYFMPVDAKLDDDALRSNWNARGIAMRKLLSSPSILYMISCLPFPSDIIACLKTDLDQAVGQAGRHQVSEREAEGNMIANYLPALSERTERLEDAQVFLRILPRYFPKPLCNFAEARYTLRLNLRLSSAS